MIPNLKYLLVVNNMVSYISPNSFRSLTDLKYLDLSKNNISILDKSLLKDNIRLNIIKLGSNPISNMPAGFFSINKVKVQMLDTKNSSLKQSCSLFSQMYVSCQGRDSGS
ncbi:uncharacterized protein LOC143048785 [Mytilus galloprovincialis]|uniref:uncharacterized protein LOC143048785 n=1 Tax=Mytilus galloprovincialis TaxID=29158 RepID=UPI003F7BCD56